MIEGTIQRADGVFTAPLPDALLMMNVQRGLYHGLNETAARVWELLEQPTTEAVVVEKLLAEFDVPAADCAAQVSEFLNDLRERNLLTERT